MEDRRLERLFDYTTCHLARYMTLGSGVIALVAGAAEKEALLRSPVAHPRLLAVAVILVAIAGLAGGVIASSRTDLPHLTGSRSYGRVGPKGGLHATSPSHHRTDPRQTA